MRNVSKVFKLGVLCLLVSVLGGCVLTQWTRIGYESANYDIISESKDFEIRLYPEIQVATTSQNLSAGGTDNNFKRLFNYISGDNETDSKIAMTTPVYIRQEGMNESMSFVVPQDVVDAGIPLPQSHDVILETILNGRFAVYRFNGSRDSNNTSQAEARLKQWLVSQNLKSTGPPLFAFFDPPWTPHALRRNEVMIRVE